MHKFAALLVALALPLVATSTATAATLFPATAKPAVVDGGDSRAVEVGVKLRRLLAAPPVEDEVEVEP